MEAFLFSCLHVTTTFLGLHPYDLGGLTLASQEILASRVGCPSRFP